MNNYNRNMESRNKADALPSLSDWLNEPLSTAIDFFGRPIESFSRPFKQWWEGVSPNMDVSETEKEVIVRVEVPGMNEKEINAMYAQGVLTIEGEKKIDEEHTKGQLKMRESKYGSFHREIPLGADMKWDSVKATCKNGVLNIIIPKSEKHEESKKIKID